MRILSTIVALAVTACGAVIEATDKDLDTYLGNGVPTILDLYATWCSHCKEFSPKFDALAAEFEHLQDRVQFVKINVDKNRKASKRFNIQYVPVIKFIDGETEEEIHSRDPKSIKSVIKKNLEIEPETKATKKPIKKISRESQEFEVVELIDDTFEDNLLGKDALVAFTTTWCAYCKQLAPIWKELARLYSRDSDVVIANVDCTDAELTYSLSKTFGVEGFPTIVYLSAENPTKFKQYSGPRTLDGFVDYLQKMGSSHRQVDGSLGEKAGLIPELDTSVLPDYDALLEQISATESKFADIYKKIINKVKDDASYLTKEIGRVTSLLESGNLKPSDTDAFQIKRNILRSLQLDSKDQTKDEL